MSRVRRSSTTMAAAAVLALVISGGTAAAASAATPVTCANFTYQEDAQAALRLNPGDPSGLDPDGNGVACESLPHRPVITPTTTTVVAPTTTPTAPTTTTAPVTTTTAPATTTTGSVVTTTSGSSTATATTTATTSAAATTTPAGDTKNCSDFATQALAQAFLLADPTDPSRLDANHNGVACEDNFGTQNQQVAVIPNGAVRTGGLPPR